MKVKIQLYYLSRLKFSIYKRESFGPKLKKKVTEVNLGQKYCRGQLRSKMLYSSKEVKKLDEIEQLEKYSRVLLWIIST